MPNLIKQWVIENNDFRKTYAIWLICIAGGYLSLFAEDIFSPDPTRTFCIFKNLTGYPCAGCGMGRSTLLMAKGHFLEALWMNPLAYPLNFAVYIGIIWMLYDLYKGKATLLPIMKTPIHWSIKVLLFVIIAINWIWNIKKGI